MTAEAAWNALRQYKREATGNPLAGITEAEFEAIQAVVGAWERKQPEKLPEARPAGNELLTARVALEIIGHEAIVREAYKDSVGVWTWGIGVTNRSGHTVYPRYKDNPQPIQRCIEVYLWLLREKYIPDVAEAFEGFALTESQFGAALSFHYNTGAILTADWVEAWKKGALDKAKAAIMNWRSPKSIIPRREKERDLFFDGKWSHDGKATVYPVKKPSYTPDWGHAERVNVRPAVEELLA